MKLCQEVITLLFIDKETEVPRGQITGLETRGPDGKALKTTRSPSPATVCSDSVFYVQAREEHFRVFVPSWFISAEAPTLTPLRGKEAYSLIYFYFQSDAASLS